MDRQGRELWAEGASARTIAIKLGLASRHAVIGRANRCQWPSPMVKRRVPRQRPVLSPAPAPTGIALPALLPQSPVRRAPPKAKPLPMIVLHATHVAGRYDAVPLLEARADQCRYMIEDGPRWIVCGCKSLVGLSWCAEHTARVFYAVRVASRVRGVAE
jgi:hypothetical protein